LIAVTEMRLWKELDAYVDAFAASLQAIERRQPSTTLASETR
jgi:hypothetical protein